MKPSTDWLQAGLKYFSSSIRNKIIIPYALLTLVLAILGVFIVTRLVAGSFEARLKNQLLDAGRVVSDGVVNRERARLEAQRAVANTEGVAEALINRNFAELDKLISPFIANYKNIDSIVLLDTQGKEVLRLQRESIAPNAPAQTYQGSSANFSSWPTIQRVLADANDGTKEVQVARDQNSAELIIYTIGPVRTSEGSIGAALVGTYLKKEIDVLHNLALADLTLFDEKGAVVYSTLAPDQAEAKEVFKAFTPKRYQQVTNQTGVTLLDEIQGPGENPNDVQARGQTYRLAYAPFLLRSRVYGVYAVALPTSFITDTNDQSRNLLALVFSAGVVLVIGIGYLVSQRIIRPIVRLAQTSQAIARGNLDQRTGLKRSDEIGILAATFDDMTSELQRLLKIQREEASKLNAILSSIADGVIVQDLGGHTVIMNPAAGKILQAMDGDFRYIQPQAVRATGATPAEAGVSPLLNLLTGLEFHETRRFEAGQRVLSALSAPVMTADKEQIGSVVVLRDITREVESERLKDDFITHVSHELRTPLTAIKGYNDLLKMTAAKKLDKRQVSFIEIIDKNVADLLQLIQEMLDLSQINAGTLGIDQEPVNLSELIDTEVKKWPEKMKERGLNFTVQLPAESIWVEGDWNRISLVVHNLIRNAYDYTLPGGSVEVLLRQENGRGQMDVKDTGVGIAAEQQRYLFTRFFRAIHAESTYEVSGAGLGLYISKAIVEAHQGEIWLESKLNEGSTFSFALPIINPELKKTLQANVEYVKTE
ncbi:MAG: HAMP domain-containing protein [Chloroflexi bacterium]|nr:HAMP domain-containing protein [Chloroflexota bacterium]